MLTTDVVKAVANVLVALSAAAGAWLAAYKWYFEEKLRRNKEIATLDGNISVEVHDVNRTTVAVFIDSQWNNKGTVPVFAVPAMTAFRIYEIQPTCVPFSVDATEKYLTDDSSNGVAIQGGSEHCVPILRVRPIQHDGQFWLEPGTESRIQASVVLNKGPFYEVRAILVTHSRPESNAPDLFWSRRKLFSSASPVPLP